MTTLTMPMPMLPASVHTHLRRAAELLAEAVEASSAAERYAAAHVSALHAAAALVAVREVPGAVRRRPRNVWVLLARCVPEFAPWAAFYASGASKRAAAEAGSERAVTTLEAEALVAESDRFLVLVEEALGVVPHAALPHGLAAQGGARA
ncbi:SAV_6107 family HEPN domain-containing protein [Nocardioides yefusunii]|uniref:SAV_6107 family HEPN domain-containing protein n=1 Tax=Nocardioides yefusunii TaxID=2500546 RepID=A0ABW1QY95_9ACTN|nr:SAV_6107 family HEPN domain-containing protein [Nocardioides yefusunii]